MAASVETQGRDVALRVLVLSKRQYMGRDLLDDRYGRFRELPLALATTGANVRGLCLSYRRRPTARLIDQSAHAAVPWYSINLTGILTPGDSGYWGELDRVLVEQNPDVIWACSDMPHAVLGVLASRRLKARLVIDLYDNFESYPIGRVPGANQMLAWAVRAADGISCVSTPLQDYVRQMYAPRGPIAVVENAVDPAVHAPRDQLQCRMQLGLPASAILIGTAGAISRSRGIEVLFQAYAELTRERTDVHLVLAGPVDRAITLPTGPRVHYLGTVAPTVVPTILSAMDAAVICNLDSAFGRYCFPQKLYEAIACGVPVIAARVGATANLLRESPASTYEPGDASSLLTRMRAACAHRSPLALPVPTWQSQGVRLRSFLDSVVERTTQE